MKSHLPLNVHFSCPFYPNVLSRYLAWITVIQRKWKFYKVFFCPGVRCITLFASEFVHCDDDHHYWSHDHNHHMFSPLALDLFWAEIQNLSLGPGDQAGLARQWAEPVWAQFNHRHKRQQRQTGPDQALAALNPPPSLCWVKDGGEYVEISWKIDSKGTPSLSWVMPS